MGADYAKDVVPLLLWMIVAVGAALLMLLTWIGQRLQKKVDDLPDTVTKQVSAVHSEIIKQMQAMNETHRGLEKDVRQQVTDLDRRLTVVEVRCGMHHTIQDRGN